MGKKYLKLTGKTKILYLVLILTVIKWRQGHGYLTTFKGGEHYSSSVLMVVLSL